MNPCGWIRGNLIANGSFTNPENLVRSPQRVSLHRPSCRPMNGCCCYSCPCSHSRGSQKNTKLRAKKHPQRTWRRPTKALCLLPRSRFCFQELPEFAETVLWCRLTCMWLCPNGPFKKHPIFLTPFSRCDLNLIILDQRLGLCFSKSF